MPWKIFFNILIQNGCLKCKGISTQTRSCQSFSFRIHWIISFVKFLCRAYSWFYKEGVTECLKTIIHLMGFSCVFLNNETIYKLVFTTITFRYNPLLSSQDIQFCIVMVIFAFNTSNFTCLTMCTPMVRKPFKLLGYLNVIYRPGTL